MENSDLINANRKYYRLHAENYDSIEQPFVYQRIFIEKILAVLRSTSNTKRLLDFGAGTGSSTQALAASFPAAELTGLDVSPEMLEIANRKCPSAVFTLYDGVNIPYMDARFDGILVSSALHHIYNYKHALEELSRVTADDGWILITQEPNPIVNRKINKIRKFFRQNFPDLLLQAEGYQFSEEGGIPPKRIMDVLTTRGFSCRLVYNNDALLDSLLHKHKVLFQCLKPAIYFRSRHLCISYNVIARRNR